MFGTLEKSIRFSRPTPTLTGSPRIRRPRPCRGPELDRWILSRLQSTAAEAAAALDDYNPTRAARAVERFIDALSNWYIRRSRDRFWAGARADANDNAGDDAVADKRAAYHTTLTCLAIRLR